MVLAALAAIIYLVEVAEGFQRHHYHLETILILFIFEKYYISMCHVRYFYEYKSYMLDIPWLILSKIAEIVLEPSDHLRTSPNRFLFKNRFCSRKAYLPAPWGLLCGFFANFWRWRHLHLHLIWRNFKLFQFKYKKREK